jgi:hypothetical protein
MEERTKERKENGVVSLPHPPYHMHGKGNVISFLRKDKKAW